MKSNHFKDDDSVRILIADDHYPDVVLVQEALHRENIAFQMLVFGDGESALEYVVAAATNQNQLDLIVLDLNLSKTNGLAVLTRIRQHRFFDATPVALLTSSLSPMQRAQAMDLKADAFITKPIALDEFLSQVGSALSQLLKCGRSRDNAG